MPGVFSKSVGWILTATKTVTKIANLGKRGVLFIWQDELGLRAVGSPEMVDRFHASRNCSSCNEKYSWEESAKRDSINLATGNANVDIDTKASNADLIKKMTEDLDIIKLPCRLEYMATSEAIHWLEIELKKDFIEQGKKPVKKIPWGNPEYIPKCWAEDIWKWETVNNPRHKQGNPPETGAKLIDVLHATIENRLREKSIDPSRHISESYTEEMDKKKRAVRGIKVKPVETNIETSPDKVVHEMETVAMEIEEETTGTNEIIGDLNNSVSSEEESFCERDEDGRRKLPSRQVESTSALDSIPSSSRSVVDHFSSSIVGLPSPAEDLSSSPQLDNSSTPSGDLSSSPPSSRSLRSGTWTRGRGKGGKRMGIRGGLVSKDSLPPRGKTVIDAKKHRRNDWQEWVKNYKIQTEKMIKKSKKKEIKCPECEENILKQSFIKHRTERGCMNLDPKLRMGNWDLGNYL